MKLLWGNKMTIKAIILDFDGTMVDSVGFWYKYINPKFFSKYNIKVDVQKGYPDEFVGMNSEEIAECLMKKYKIDITPEELKKEWLNIAVRYLKKMNRLKKGVKEFICFAAKNDVKLGIASNNYKEIIEQCLSANNIQHYFKAIVTENDVKRVKPFPDIYLKCAEKLEVKPENCLVFEDTLDGVIAAKRAGMKVYAVYDKYSSCHMSNIMQFCDKYIVNFYEVMNMFDDRMVV